MSTGTFWRVMALVIFLLSPAAAAGEGPKPAAVRAPEAGEKLPDVQLSLHPDNVVNGGVTLAVVQGVVAGDQVTGTFNGQAMPFAAGEGTATALIGVDMDVEPGRYPVAVKVRRASGETAASRFDLVVEDAGYTVEKLTLPPGKVSGFDEKTLARIKKDAKDFSSLWPVWSGERHWSGSFMKPVPGDISSVFGGRRVINGEPRSPHSGIDQRGATGTPILAVNAGRVAYVGDHFFSGNVTVLDHGHGIYSVYAHQSKVLVEKGQTVAAGEKIGEIGMTGRASGPHLHWGLRVNQARVDPIRLLELDLTVTATAGKHASGAPGDQRSGKSKR